MSLLLIVECHLRARALAPSRFGRLATGDLRFVFDLRRGREPRAATRERVLAHIARTERGQEGGMKGGVKGGVKSDRAGPASRGRATSAGATSAGEVAHASAM
jgi:hypothetical protein